MKINEGLIVIVVLILIVAGLHFANNSFPCKTSLSQSDIFSHEDVDRLHRLVQKERAYESKHSDTFLKDIGLD